MTKLVSCLPTDRYLYLFGLLNPLTGANNIVISASSSTFIQSVSASYTNAAQIGLPDSTASNTGTGTSLTTTLTTVKNNTWGVLYAYGNAGAAPFTSGTNCTMRKLDATYGRFGIFDSNSDIVPPGSFPMTFNASSATLTSVAASFAPPNSTPGNMGRYIRVGGGMSRNQFAS